MAANDPIADIANRGNAELMTGQSHAPLEERAASLRRMTPALIADLQLYPSVDGGKQIAALPGWGCPCMVSRQRPFSGYDGWPVLSEPLQPGDKRAAVPFVFLSAEGADAMRKAGHFFLWEGRFVGEAVVVG